MLMAVMVFILGACSRSSSKSYTFNVETGDKNKVELDTSSGLSLSQMDSSRLARMMRSFWREYLYMRMGIRAIFRLRGSRV